MSQLIEAAAKCCEPAQAVEEEQEPCAADDVVVNPSTDCQDAVGNADADFLQQLFCCPITQVTEHSCDARICTAHVHQQTWAWHVSTYFLILMVCPTAADA